MFLCHHKGKGRGSHPKLCRRHKEEVPGIFYLHGLASEKADAGLSEGMDGIAEAALHPAYDKGESFPVLFLWSGYRPRALRGSRSGRRNTPAGRSGWNPWHHHKIPVKFRCILL